MALNRLTIPEMVNLTKVWAEPGHPVRAALERIPALLAIMPFIEEVLATILAAQRIMLAQTVADISAAQALLDARHDDLARALHYRLDADIPLARARGDEAQVQSLEKLREFLFPDGLRVVTMSYREEAGRADLLASRMTQEQRDLLARIPVDGGSLLGVTTEWLDVGNQLGQLEDQRADASVPGRQANALEARNEWIQMIHAVRDIVHITRSNDPVLAEALHRIRVAEKARERATPGGADASNAEVGPTADAPASANPTDNPTPPAPQG